MPKLNQVLAIEKGVKSRAYAEMSELHKVNQKPALFAGFRKEFKPVEEGGEALPPENTRVQYVATEMLRSFERHMCELMETTARRDWTNCMAKADIKLGDIVLVAAVPATYLLFLEKQLSDLHDFAMKLPVLDEADEWKKDESSNYYKTEPIQTHRTKKTAKALVLYPATDKHPAQTQVLQEDVISGYWNTVKMSGAMPRAEKLKLLEWIEALTNAVKQARESANMQDVVEPPKIGTGLFNYLLGGG